MKIAFTHNLKLSDAEDEAEFDTQETVSAIRTALARLGHQVELVEVSGPPSKTIARLEALNPDLVFNTAEGRLGRYREAFFPGVFEQLGIPFTGSDAYACTLTLDKNLTKIVVAGAGIPTPKAEFVRSVEDPKLAGLRFPVILKPCFEGSSKGITQDSVVEDAQTMRGRLAGLLERYPDGILVEEYVVGKDVTVPFLEGVASDNGGILSPVEYVFNPEVAAKRRYQIYDYELKNSLSDMVDVKAPADIPKEASAKLIEYSRKAIQVLGIRDFGRIDYRVTPDGRIYFIEVNALPSLEPGAGIYLAAEKSGLRGIHQVLGAIIESAVHRYGIVPFRSPRGRHTKRMTVGFTYNEKRVTPGVDPATDLEAEYDSPKTLNAIRDAIRSFGHELVDFEATPDLLHRLAAADVDVVFNVAEGIRGRNREAQIPAILELLDIPYTGSDPATLSLTLDKGLAKRIVREAGIHTAPYLLLVTGKEKLPPDLKFPLIVKPVAEGSSKGVVEKSVVADEAEMRAVAIEQIKRYRQGALAEEFLSGREFTVALLGERRPRVLPPMEVIFNQPGRKYTVYSYESKLAAGDQIKYEAPAQVDPALRTELERVARRAFLALGCRDVARIDLRLDSAGRVNFIECNPLPGLTPGWSDLCMIAESAGMDYRTLIGEILSPAIRRYKEKRKLLMQATGAKVEGKAE